MKEYTLIEAVKEIIRIVGIKNISERDIMAIEGIYSTNTVGKYTEFRYKLVSSDEIWQYINLT